MASVTETVHVLLVLIQVHYATSEIRVQPRDTEAVVGQMTYLNCSTSLPSKGILWYHYPLGASESNYVYLMGQFQRPYNKRFILDTQSETGEFNLVIQSVETDDAGKYVCHEEGEQGQYKIAELIVLDVNPVCGSNMKEDGVIGNNSCDIKPEEFQLSCSISFHGNIPPIVEWSEVGKDDTIGEGIHQDNSTSHITSYLTISGHQNRNGSSFVCHTTRSKAEQNRCISDVIKIMYVFNTLTSTQAVVGENTTCSANSSQPCFYKWKWSDDKKEEIASDGATIELSKPGLYICEAECKIRQKTCSVVAKLVQVSSVAPTSADHRRLIILAVATSMLTAVVICNAVLYRRFHQRHLNGSTEDTERMIMIPGHEICGLTMLHEELYISRLHSTDVEVYDTMQFAFRRRWRVNDLVYPTDLICNGNHLCLFDFKDLGQDCEIFTVTSTGELVNKWSTGSNWGTISASNDSHVILTVYTTGRLIEYSSDGQLLRQIVLAGADILNPWHAIKLTNGNYVVCYGRYGLPQHRVCVVRLSDKDNEGEINIGKNDIIKTFGGKKGSSLKKVNVPIRLDVGANGSIYVAVHNNSRILVIDSKLKAIRELVSAKEGGLRRLRRLHLDRKKDRLLVSDYSRVLVCHLSQNRRQWFDINPANSCTQCTGTQDI